MTDHKDVGVGKRFATDWHRDRYGDDLERELLGVRQRLADEELEPEVRKGWEGTEKAILADLKGLGRSQERPSGRGKQTR